jgi:hypothetical protein
VTLGTNWGATAQERALPLACDEDLAGAGLVADRAISIAAPAEVVYRWLCQLRAAPYSYDWLDNGGRRSPRQLTPGLERLAAGQRFMSIFRLRSFTPGEQITLRTRRVAVTYAVRPTAEGSRLLVRIRAALPGVLATPLALGDLVMMRKQLLTLRELAERHARCASTSACSPPRRQVSA